MPSPSKLDCPQGWNNCDNGRISIWVSAPGTPRITRDCGALFATDVGAGPRVNVAARSARSARSAGSARSAVSWRQLKSAGVDHSVYAIVLSVSPGSADAVMTANVCCEKSTTDARQQTPPPALTQKTSRATGLRLRCEGRAPTRADVGKPADVVTATGSMTSIGRTRFRRSATLVGASASTRAQAQP
jgi:hypothetical protein